MFSFLCLSPAQPPRLRLPLLQLSQNGLLIFSTWRVAAAAPDHVTPSAVKGQMNNTHTHTHRATLKGLSMHSHPKPPPPQARLRVHRLLSAALHPSPDFAARLRSLWRHATLSPGGWRHPGRSASAPPRHGDQKTSFQASFRCSGFSSWSTVALRSPPHRGVLCVLRCGFFSHFRPEYHFLRAQGHRSRFASTGMRDDATDSAA